MNIQKDIVDTLSMSNYTQEEINYITGIKLLAMSDTGVFETKRLKQAIKELESLIYTRENIPF